MNFLRALAASVAEHVRHYLAVLPAIVDRVKAKETQAVAWYKAHHGQIVFALHLAEGIPWLSDEAAALEAVVSVLDEVVATLDTIEAMPVAGPNPPPPSRFQAFKPAAKAAPAPAPGAAPAPATPPPADSPLMRALSDATKPGTVPAE